MDASTSPNTKTWCVLCHAAALSGLFLHMVGFLVGPLVVWLAKRHESPEIDAYGRESLNFQISMLIYNVVAGILWLVVVGIFLTVILFVVNIVLVIIASVKASEGQLYRYPFTIRFLN